MKMTFERAMGAARSAQQFYNARREQLQPHASRILNDVNDTRRDVLAMAFLGATVIPSAFASEHALKASLRTRQVLQSQQINPWGVYKHVMQDGLDTVAEISKENVALREKAWRIAIASARYEWQAGGKTIKEIGKGIRAVVTDGEVLKEAAFAAGWAAAAALPYMMWRRRLETVRQRRSKTETSTKASQEGQTLPLIAAPAVLEAATPAQA